MKKLIWVIVALGLVFGLLPLTSQAAPLKTLNWRAEYYDNPNLAGFPKLVTYVNKLSIDFKLNSPGPEIPPDFFSARYTDNRHFERGVYLFVLSVDDGARLWLDGELIIDGWDIGPQQDLKAKVYFEEGGEHEIQVAFFDSIGESFVHLDWFQLADAHGIAGAWQGNYFLNTSLAGEAVLVRNDDLHFDWNSGAPSRLVTRDNFSVRWTRSIYLEREGYYFIRLQHDDGMRIYVDGKIIYESWYDQPVIYKIIKVPLKAGYRNFVVEYYDHLGNATAYVDIVGDPGNYSREEIGPGDPIGVVVENEGGHFAWSEPLVNRYVRGGGHGENFFWTYNTDYVSDNYGKWTPPISPGNYEIFAYIPADGSTTTRARYTIYHFGQEAERVINQSRYYDEFVSLGIYYFDGSLDECVVLYDNTGESPGSTQIAFDALKFVKR